ncbi:arginase deacetylase [Coniophora puteana RWD-64-598 SS2]|uniref:Arginase deacetylase n=1 Tax=Coniophora puteana (strain RWD-64-598) TaxID=741705 RepID=A0A5M3MPM5_CONPW|nr:arginase deacetylase [Coniophora puteana RWD-64-598 SS2]EIW81142.1 arginase deacetylase [Coniophora puteana RWD-64-598 SS2]
MISHPSATRNTTVYLQDACLLHRYIRSRDTSGVVERPQRVRAVKVGLAAALARLEGATARQLGHENASRSEPGRLSGNAVVEAKAGASSLLSASEPDDLASALGRLNLAKDDTSAIAPGIRVPGVNIVKSTATVDILDHAAVKYIHGDIEGDVYLENIKEWARTSKEKIVETGREIPEGYPPLDLYLCPESVDAMQGAIGAVCEAVDDVLSGSTGDPRSDHAFVAVRPPGHHCGEDTPAGFCFVNNVAIGAAHAHLKHGINRIVILDIDLHHGNGTQSIVWQINEESYRQALESEQAPGTSQNAGPRIYYGSLHDVLSFPCEDGKPELVQAASVSIHGSHGQHIENIHLQAYESDQHFWGTLYSSKYRRLLSKAEEFLNNTGGPGDDVIYFISCGFDACEHEYESMSRHGRKVPTSFYHRFTREICASAERYARGRVISVLEGGYSDRALESGAMAHLCGLVDPSAGAIDEDWWSVDNLVKLEKATKPRKGGRQSISTFASEPWLSRASEILAFMEPTSSSSSKKAWMHPSSSSRSLRDRKKPDSSVSSTTSPAASPRGKSAAKKAPKASRPLSDKESSPTTGSAPDQSWSSSSSVSEGDVKQEVKVEDGAPSKKLPKVILRVRPPADAP